MNVPYGSHFHASSVVSLSLTFHNLETEWFDSTRLETRAKESNIFASCWMLKSACEMKVISEKFASDAD